MIKYFCDKCNKNLVDYDIFDVEISPPEIRDWDTNAYTGKIILCKNCLKEFYKWLKKR